MTGATQTDLGASVLPRWPRAWGAVLLLVVLATTGCQGTDRGDRGTPTLSDLLERADNWDGDAMFALGTRYANGDGVARDNVTAYMFFLLAAEFSTTETKYESERMQLVLDPEMFRHQIYEAERLAGLWKARRRQADG